MLLIKQGWNISENWDLTPVFFRFTAITPQETGSDFQQQEAWYLHVQIDIDFRYPHIADLPVIPAR